MTEKKSYQSWTISDELWNEIKDEIPQKERDPEKVYKHKPGQGRKPMDARKALEGIFYVLRTGCQWKALPKEFGSSSSIHRYFQAWTKAGRRISVLMQDIRAVRNWYNRGGIFRIFDLVEKKRKKRNRILISEPDAGLWKSHIPFLTDSVNCWCALRKKPITTLR